MPKDMPKNILIISSVYRIVKLEGGYMSVEKKNGKWYIRGKIKRDDGSYYEYRKVAQCCTGKKEAQEYERQFRKQYQDIQVSLSHKSFREVAEEYLLNLDSQKKASIRSYSDKANKICEVFGDKKINLIGKDLLQKYIRSLEEHYSEEYVAKFFYILKSIFDYAIMNDMIAVNPMNKVRRKVDKNQLKKEMDFWEPDEFEKFISVVDDLQAKTFFTFLFWMGTRKSEACALQWKDIDFDTDTVKIYKTVTYKIKGTPWEVTTPKTPNSNRNITMFRVVRDTLITWKEVCSKMYAFSEDCFVFGYSRPLSDNAPRRLMDKYVNIYNDNHNDHLKRIRIHDFRHSHASYLINNMGKYNYTDFDIAKRIGDTVSMLHKTYAHQFKGKDKEIIDSIENSQETKNIDNVALKNDHDYIHELKMLKELCDSGILTEEEFQLKKKKILGI